VVSLPHSKSNGDPSDGQNRGKINLSTWEELESGPNRVGRQDQDMVCDRIWVLGVLVLIPVGSRNRISELLIEKYVIGLYLLYTSQNLLGTIFRVTFAVLYRRIWSIIGNYSILYYDKRGTLGEYSWKEMEKSFHFENYSLLEGDSYASIEALIIEICLAGILIFGSTFPQ
jgi:hypothetical protein